MEPDRVEVALRDGRRAVVAFTTRATGDLAVGAEADELERTRATVVDVPWTSLTQVHGSRVVEVTAPGEHAGEPADAAFTDVTGAALSVQAADCAPIALVDDAGAVGVVHAGWKGLLDGVIAAAVGAMRARPGSGSLRAWLGACIHPECYEFSSDDLDPIADRFGPGVVGRTSMGGPALDLPAAVTAALAELDVPVDRSHASCTACDESRWFSHRARQEAGRHAVVGWIEDP